MRRTLTLALTLCLIMSLFIGIGGAAAAEGKTMIIGDTTFNPENSEPDVNPHNDYAGWPCIRYGIGETLIRYSDTMETEPWLATDWSNDGGLVWTITLRDDVYFSSGRYMDAEAVKQCLEHLMEAHDRAPGDLMIDSMEADGQVLTITTKEPRPALLNYLGDPYGCIIDVNAGFDNGIVAGTGPYIAVDCQSHPYHIGRKHTRHGAAVGRDRCGLWDGLRKLSSVPEPELSIFQDRDLAGLFLLDEL